MIVISVNKCAIAMVRQYFKELCLNILLLLDTLNLDA